MTVAIRLNGNHRDLHDRLVASGVKCKLVKNGLMVYMTNNVIPDGIAPNPSFLRMLVHEEGGFRDGVGRSVVVCGLSGKPLRPVFASPDPPPCGKHALFSVSGSCVVVTATASDEAGPSVSLALCETYVRSRRACVRERVLFKGDPSSLPENLKHFSAAVNAAAEKARCPECSGLHYAVYGEYAVKCDVAT